jgi:hypothetical protein
VAALVSAIDPDATVVDLVNLDPGHDRTVIVQAGAFAEHTIEAVRYTACPDGSWMGGLYDYGHGEPVVAHRQANVSAPWLTVHLPASTRIQLTLRLGLRRRTPSYATPFDGSPAGEGNADASGAAAAARPAAAGEAAGGAAAP